MEGCRRLSFCAFADHPARSLSDRERELQGHAGRRWRRSGPRRRRWRRIGWRATSVCRAEDAACCGCCSSGSSSSSQTGCSSKADSDSTSAGRAAGCRGAAGCVCDWFSDRYWNWNRRDNRVGSGQWRRNWLRHWDGNRKRQWSGHRRRARQELSADSDAVLSSAASCAGVTSGIPSHCVFRCW